MNEPDDGKLRDSEVALLDAIKTILEIVIAKGILSPQVIDEMLARQSQSYPPEMPRAVFVMDLIRAFVMDPKRAELREQIRRIQQEPPAGSA
jgi:hypothetical protein